MFSTTGYFSFGSKFVGRKMTPQMSVVPSRPLATKASGAFHPAFVRSVMSAFSSSITSDASAERRSSVTGGRSMRE